MRSGSRTSHFPAQWIPNSPGWPKLAARRPASNAGYDAIIEAKPGQDPAEFLTMEFTNWREREQAQNICRVLAAAPGDAGGAAAG